MEVLWEGILECANQSSEGEVAGRVGGRTRKTHGRLQPNGFNGFAEEEQAASLGMEERGEMTHSVGKGERGNKSSINRGAGNKSPVNRGTGNKSSINRGTGNALVPFLDAYIDACQVTPT